MKAILRILFVAILSFWSTASMADPVLVGEMQKLVTFEGAQVMPELLMDSIDDKRYFMSDFSGRIILLNLWATWCPPCVGELASLDKLEAELGGDNFKVVAISMDEGMTPDDIADFFKEHGIENLQVFLDYDSSTSNIPNLFGLPTSYILAENGNMFARYEGDANWSSPESIAVMRYYIDEMKKRNSDNTDAEDK